MSTDTGGLWLVGCGNMAGAMLRRWLEAGTEAAIVTVVDPGKPQVPPGVRHLAEPPADAAPDTLLLGVKPQLLDHATQAWGDTPTRLLVSILAGVDLATLRTRFPRAQAIVRAMPNLPVALGKGVVALHGDASARAEAETLMAPLGLVEWIGREDQFDAVTALSGCGPGFTYRFIDALAAAGVALGLPADQAQRLAIATVDGAGALAAASDESPATLADRVASPGGATREGLNVLDRDDALVRLLTETLRAAADRSAAMADAAKR